MHVRIDPSEESMGLVPVNLIVHGSAPSSRLKSCRGDARKGYPILKNQFFKVLLPARLRNDVNERSELAVAKIVKAPGFSREDLTEESRKQK
jgi:hypothetical protein